MGRSLCPDLYIASVFDIDLQLLLNKGIFNIIIDIDNTLSRWGSVEPEPMVCEWISRTRRMGFKVCILSNSAKKRVRIYCSGLDVFFVENVHKPLKYPFIKAMALMNSNRIDTCVIGDQIFTDILGGKLCGLFTILVKPIDDNEFIFTKLMRSLEKIVLKKYFNQH